MVSGTVIANREVTRLDGRSGWLPHERRPKEQEALMRVVTAFTDVFGFEHPIAQGGMQAAVARNWLPPVANVASLDFTTALTQSASVGDSETPDLERDGV